MKLTARSLVMITLLIVAAALLIRIIARTPIIQSITESFANAPSQSQLLNTATECPPGYQMYMYEGSAFCCRGNVNPDAANLGASCIPMVTEAKDAHCALGPASSASSASSASASKGIPNCNDIQAGILLAKGETLCPPSKPNFCSAGEAGRCCTSAVSSDGTKCIDETIGRSCNVGKDPNIFKDPNDCRYQRMKEKDRPCRPKYHSFTSPVSEGPLAGLTLYGCTNLVDSCYSENMVDALKELGYDVSRLTICPNNS
jgi:hypothetical protein